MRSESFREYASGALWIPPFAAGTVALLAAWGISQVTVPPDSVLARFEFQGDYADARNLLFGISGTVVTVIALVLGLSVVALQLSSTQFSPRLLRNFLRDRPNQVALSVFLATFAYSAALLFSVGAGPDPEDFSRLAVSGAIVLLFASMGMVVYFADHLSHSLQVEAIMRRVERETLDVIRHSPVDVVEHPPSPPSWALGIPATSSGYVQTTHPELLLPMASRYGVGIALTRGVGQHIAMGETLAWVWTPAPDQPAPDLGAFEHAFAQDVGIGFERTRQQDVAVGIRQLVDVASKALSPAVNDPYTAVQAIHHLTVIFGAMARHPLGPRVARDPGGTAVVVVPSRLFGQYLGKMCGLIRRYGSAEPTISTGLLRLLSHTADVARADADRLDAIAEQGRLVTDDARREIAQPADLEQVVAENEELQAKVARYRQAI